MEDVDMQMVNIYQVAVAGAEVLREREMP